jgi:hypothetical protein
MDQPLTVPVEDAAASGQTPNTRPLLEWKAPSSAHHIRSERWYAIGGAAVIAMAAYGIITGAWTFTVVILLCGAMYMLLRGHAPPLKSIAMWEHGFLYERTFIRWEDIAGFWFIHAPDFSELHLQKKTDDQTIMIHVRDVDFGELRAFLSHFAPEITDKKERLLDIIIRICKL